MSLRRKMITTLSLHLMRIATLMIYLSVMMMTLSRSLPWLVGKRGG
jgi:hypothetical protein